MRRITRGWKGSLKRRSGAELFLALPLYELLEIKELLVAKIFPINNGKNNNAIITIILLISYFQRVIIMNIIDIANNDNNISCPSTLYRI
jgi:hypothetical protein